MWDICDYLGWYTCDSTNTQSLAEAGNYPYGKVHGVQLWPFWLDEIEGNAEFVQAYIDIGTEYFGQETLPSDMGYTWYVGIKAIIEAARTTPDDLSPEAMTNALSTVHFSTLYGDDLYFRDFDHVMAHAYYYVTAVETRPASGISPSATSMRCTKATKCCPPRKRWSSTRPKTTTPLPT